MILVKNVLSNVVDRWSIPLIWKGGHVYVEWPSKVMYTECELGKTHRHFNHPRTENLYLLLMRAELQAVDHTKHTASENIYINCDVIKDILTNRTDSGYLFLMKTACSVVQCHYLA